MLNHQDYCSWTDEGNGTWSFGTCGVQMRVENTQWDTGLPGGKHIKGTAATIDTAKQRAFDEFCAFAIRRLIEHAVNLPAHAPA